MFRRSLLFWCFVLVSGSSSAQSFLQGTLQGESSTNPTTLQLGPDGRVYVGQQNGLIRIYDVSRTGPASYQVVSTETITLVRQIPNHNDDGSLNASVTDRQVTGILVTGTGSQQILYVTSSDPRIKVNNTDPPSLSLDTNSGVLSV